MPRLKKKEESSPSVDTSLTLTAGRSRRTIKPNRKYLNDSVVLATTSQRSSSPESDASEDDYNHDEEEDDEEVIQSKSAVGRKSTGLVPAKNPVKVATPTGRPRGRPPKAVAKTEPVKNLRKEVLKKMDLSTLNMAKARVVLTPINKDFQRKLDMDVSLVKEKKPRGRPPTKHLEKPAGKQMDQEKEKFAPKSPEGEEEKFRRKQSQDTSPIQDLAVNKKLINPAALLKKKVEKSIMDKRFKKTEDSSHLSTENEEGDEDDDEDEVKIIGIGRETAPNVGRKTMRKSPLIPKQSTPLARKVGKPVAKTSPSPTIAAGRKRKAGADSSADDSGHKPPARRGRPPKAAKLSIPADSTDEIESDYEPGRRNTRFSMGSDNGSAASSPQNASVKAKDSSAPTKQRKDSADLEKNTLSKSISLPALDRVKTVGRPPGYKSMHTPASKGLSKPVAQSTPKPALGAVMEKKSSKSEVNLVDPIHSTEKERKEFSKKSKDNATIRIVSIGDILKKRSSSTPDVRKADNSRKTPQNYDSSSSDSDESDDYFSTKASSAEKSKTNNQLVASILERKRPVNLDHLRINRPSKRTRPIGLTKPIEKSVTKPSVINLTNDDEVDFEDMLQTNIVTANKVQKIVASSTVPRGRGRPPIRSDENASRSESKTLQSIKGSMTTGVKTLASNNNNNLYKPYNNGRLSTSSTLNRSAPTSPQKNPPRILNSTMKLGDSRPFAKLVANSGNKHYSIDLTDPDNNVKLIVSSDSPPSSPAKRSPIKSVPRPIVASTGLRNTSNALNKPIGGAVQRSISAITSSSGSSPKMKKITCYETWYVINIPNTENKPERPSFAMSMIGLGNEAANIQLPSSEWSHKIILTKRKVLPVEGEEVFSGDVEDRAITEEEKRNYEPCNIMFRRRTATPGKFNLQYDRAVIFKNDTYFINVDGKNCQLVGAPNKVNGTEDIETLLAVVDFVNLKNTCVELSVS